MKTLKAPARAPKISFSHFGINVRDMERMEDFYTRVVGLCQLDEVAWAHREHIDTATPEGHERAEVLSRCMDDAALHVFGFAPGASRGIHHEDVPADCRVAYDLRCVLRRALAERRIAEREAAGDEQGAQHVRGTTCMRGFRGVGAEPAAVVEVVERQARTEGLNTTPKRIRLPCP